MKYYFFLVVFISTVSCWSQDNDYISTEYKEGLTLRLQTAAEQIQMEFKTNNDTTLSILYRPNNLSKSGIKVAYNGIGLALMVKSANYGRDPELFGRTDQVGLKFSVNRRKWGLDFNYQRVRGFYVENPGQYLSPQLEGLPPLKRKDILSKNLMISAIQVFNADKFSYRMQTNQNEIQIKNAGSFLLKYNIVSDRLTGDTSFIPQNYVPFFSGLEQFRSGRFNSLILQPGYTHTYVLNEKLSFNFNTLLGIGFQTRRLVSDNDKVLRTNGLGSKFDLGVSFMYFRPKFFIGLTTGIEIVGTRIKKAKYNIQNIETLFFIGHRFKKVKILPKLFEKLSN